MAIVQSIKPLSSRTVEVMKPRDEIKVDTGENAGLRVKCGATGVKIFFYRFVQRGANVQAENILREFSAVYEFAIGLGYFSDELANPALLAKSSLRQAKVRLTYQRGKRVLSDASWRHY